MMNRYEQTMYERDLPGIRKSLESIAKSLKEIEKKIIISDPGDEVEHIAEDEDEINRDIILKQDKNGKYIVLNDPADMGPIDMD